jgi:hypothetical protein
MTAAKQNKGASSRTGPNPQACSAAISLSWYMRPKVSTTASNSPTGTMTDKIHERAERDQIEYHAPAVLIVRRLAEHPGQLVRYQNRHQNAGHRQPGLHDLAQHISLHGPFHGVELRAFQ